MKKLISKIEKIKVLNREEQKSINGASQCYFDCHNSCLASSNGCRSHYAACMDVCTLSC